MTFVIVDGTSAHLFCAADGRVKTLKTENGRSSYRVLPRRYAVRYRFVAGREPYRTGWKSSGPRARVFKAKIKKET